jgi:hypothetical protein
VLGGCRIVVLQGRGRSRGGWTSKVTGRRKAAVSGVKSGHFRRQSHRSSYSSCRFIPTCQGFQGHLLTHSIRWTSCYILASYESRKIFFDSFKEHLDYFQHHYYWYCICDSKPSLFHRAFWDYFADSVFRSAEWGCMYREGQSTKAREAALGHVPAMPDIEFDKVSEN